MAKVLFAGTGAIDIRGKIGGTVYSKGRYGAYIRNKVTPVNVRSAAQQSVRAVLSFFSQAFRGLSLDQINAWNAAAANGYTTTNIFGNTIKKTGLGLYVALNTNLRTIGEAAIANPPIQEPVGNMVAIVPVAAAGANTMFLFGENFAGGNTVDADTTLVILASPPVSMGVSFVSSQMRIIDLIVTTTNTDTYDIRPAYEARFGPLVAGQKIFVGCTAVNSNTGQAGIPLKASLVVAA